ncbi:hypothetical protein JAAARDRAFT_427495 [Jaapia argillacea MUCL 33604]|uniref:Uncharacterized protein n=1 Tax=Jaapia argillacea MUCL 33604 TaxID=933084 RepID=A0A067PQE7_9AGAM|nr:hypothetical protein JAAARDRAFT_427495 [Jaapia argillacea MUCL 33604]
MSSLLDLSTPGAALRAVSESLPEDEFARLLAKYLYPVLDSLPSDQCRLILRAVQDIKKEGEEVQELMDAIDYDGHEESLEGGLKGLLKHVKREWKEGYEEQAEMMTEIAEEVVGWLPTLWRVGVERGIEIPLIHKCLVLCTSIIDRVGNTDSRSTFSDMDFTVTIKRSDEVVVYAEEYANIDHALHWLWREMALSALAHGCPANVTNAIMSDIKRLKLTSDVEGMIRVDDEETNTDGYSFHDSHWTDDMKAAVPSLSHALTKSRIASFEAAPDVVTYKTLVGQSPALKPALLESTRRHIFPADQHHDPTITYASAVAIFIEARSMEDVTRLLGTSSMQHRNTPDILAAKRQIVSYFSRQDSPDFRQKALSIIQDCLLQAERAVWDEASDVFPYLDSAHDWLSWEIDDEKFSARQPAGLSYEEESERERILERFVEVSKRGEDNEGWGYGHDDDEDMRGVDSDDSDYQKIKGERRPDLERTIREWVGILLDWPDKDAAQKVWDAVRVKRDAGDPLVTDPFWDVDGAAEALISGCSRPHVADGLQAVCDTYLCPDLATLQKKQPKSTTIGSFTITTMPMRMR